MTELVDRSRAFLEPLKLVDWPVLLGGLEYLLEHTNIDLQSVAISTAALLLDEFVNALT